MRLYVVKRKSVTSANAHKKLVDKNVMRTSYNIRADNGGGLIGRDYVDFCDSAEIGREKTAPKKRQQNVVVESAT